MKRSAWYHYHFITKSGKVLRSEICAKIPQYQKDNTCKRLSAEHGEEVICKIISIQS